MTCCVAKLRMIDWMDKVNKMFRASGMLVELALFYVDDVRFILRGFTRGFHWDKTECKFTHTGDREIWDREQDLPDDSRVAGEVLKAMNSVAPDLSFTKETMSDYPDRSIPTLDFSLSLDLSHAHPTLVYTFFSKPMSCRYVVLETSAWAWTSKCASLAQEVQRRLQNTSRPPTQSSGPGDTNHLPSKAQEIGLLQGPD